MNPHAGLVVALMACSLVMSAGAPGAHGQDGTDVQVGTTSSRHEVRYVSGNVVYVEGLVRGQWVGLGWSVGSAEKLQQWKNPLAAFELEIKTDPAQVSATSLSSGWKWQSASELPRTERGARHFVVNLSNRNQPVVLKVHTLLDGTAVLTRWIEITNTSSKPLALTAMAPWSGRLWSGNAPITLGHSLRWKYPWEGWFGWTPLGSGANVFSNDRGLAYDDPAFVLRNESNGEYFFGQLAKSPNYDMEFQRGDGLTFRIGPAALHPLRVIAPRETIKTPVVHLGHVKADFDLIVQAMHDHIRRSVLPTRRPERAQLIEYLIPEDQPETVYRSDDNNETNMKKCMDVAAGAGMEVFILDGPTWATAYGNWMAPDEKRFPRGLAPLVEYAHAKGLLFGLYVEPEGGREGKPAKKSAAGVGPWSESKVFQEHPDWFVQPASVLNLAIPEAAVYMESQVAHIIEHYKLDLYRHDFCAELRGQGSETPRDGFIENDYWRHYDAFYGIFGHIHREFPDLILQQASGGGSRTDLGIVAVFQEQHTSDRATFPYMFRMLAGFSVFLPPETLVNANGWLGRKTYPTSTPRCAAPTLWATRR